MWELDYKESWVVKSWCFWSVVLEKTLHIPWSARRFNQFILMEIHPEYPLEGLILKLKSNPLATWCEELTHLKRLRCWERLKAGGEGNKWQKMRWLDGIINSMDMNSSKLWESVVDRGAYCRVRLDWVTELTELIE